MLQKCILSAFYALASIRNFNHMELVLVSIDIYWKIDIYIYIYDEIFIHFLSKVSGHTKISGYQAITHGLLALIVFDSAAS